MAENEYLDSQKARRWMVVAKAIHDRRSLEEIGTLALDCFGKTLRSIARDVPFADWIAAIDNPSELRRSIDSVIGANDVKYFLIEAAEKGGEREHIIKQFLTQAFGNCLYDIPRLAVRLGGDVTLSEARHNLNDVLHYISSEIQRMAKELSEKPNWRPRSSKDKSSGPEQNRTTKMLNESLITGHKQ